MNETQEKLSQLLLKTASCRCVNAFARENEHAIGGFGQASRSTVRVAVVGRVKAGKSTFINAFLEAADELAKVGVTENYRHHQSFY